MTVEGRISVEEGQSIEQIDEIRNGLRDIYDSQEVKDAVWEYFSGRQEAVMVRKAPYAYQLFRREVGNLGPDYSDLKLRRFNNLQVNGSYSDEMSYTIDASSPHRIRVFEYSRWPWNKNAFGDDDTRYIYGEEAIKIAREVILSYNQQRLPQP
jgi:hypothetical protein